MHGLEYVFGHVVAIIIAWNGVVQSCATGFARSAWGNGRNTVRAIGGAAERRFNLSRQKSRLA